MRRTVNISNELDWSTILIYFALVIMGWLNIYAAVYDEEVSTNIFNLSLNSGRQLIFIGISTIIIVLILTLDYKFYETFAYPLYGLVILILVAVMLFGREINGARSWIEIGSFRFQPSEIAKFATGLAIARYMSSPGFKMANLIKQLIAVIIFVFPALLIILQGDTGTALVFGAFLFVMFREGMSPIFLIGGMVLGVIFILTLMVDNLYIFIGLAAIALLFILFSKKSFKRIAVTLGVALFIGLTVIGIDYSINNVLKPHQQNRIKVLINPNIDPLGAGWNITQSKIAIGSGGFTGKGFLNGTQTKFDFVPEQSTDFIFCTIGEEQGWIGSSLIIILFLILLFRIIVISERQKQRFTRIYGYTVASILFLHFAINIGMTIGLFPVIGIPLPFFSYGGSSLISFTILLFILLKLDAHRNQMLARA